MLHAGMRQLRSKTAIEAAAEQLRATVLETVDGALLGSEDALISSLSVSRVTFLQAARLLEREGYLRVRRGINGGYFGARPNTETIERAVSAYLDTLDMDPEDITTVASALWVEAARKAATVKSPEMRALADKFQKRLKAIKPDAPFSEISNFEMEFQSQIFALIKSPYIQLIFDINIGFAQRRFGPESSAENAEGRSQFLHAWRQAKGLEISTIADGDPGLAALAARHTRTFVHKRVWALTRRALEPLRAQADLTDNRTPSE